jgi:hypothetical protein
LGSGHKKFSIQLALQAILGPTNQQMRTETGTGLTPREIGLGIRTSDLGIEKILTMMLCYQ